ncbi:MAG: hypothetical protein Q4A39_06080 [Eubacteriales bacterium]|nr:hypothetical protein [Eubacteriales bacterium]
MLSLPQTLLFPDGEGYPLTYMVKSGQFRRPQNKKRDPEENSGSRSTPKGVTIITIRIREEAVGVPMPCPSMLLQMTMDRSDELGVLPAHPADFAPDYDGIPAVFSGSDIGKSDTGLNGGDLLILWAAPPWMIRL